MSQSFKDFLIRAIGSIMIGVGARMLVSEKWRDQAQVFIAAGVYWLTCI